MKILNVYFNNINSLAGETRIDFDKAPIADAGVFAIIGPNGSGKTSILDAISLALYGETFRFNKPAENVITKNTSACFAQVEFLVSGEKYRSRWQVKRQDASPKAQMMAAQMQLVHLQDEEQIIQQGVHQVLAFNTAITGMNFRRFSRSIMLAQGDFAAFLNALDAERLDILERIISHDVYTDYKQQVNTSAKQAEQQLTSLQVRLGKIDLMTADQREAAYLDLEDQKLIFTQLKQENTGLLQLQASLQNRQQLEQSIDQIKRIQSADQQRKVQAQTDLVIIANSTDALSFKQGLDSVAEKQGLIEQAQQQQAIYHRALQKIQDKLALDAVDENKLANLTQQDPEIRQQKIAELKAKTAQIKAERLVEIALLNALEAQLQEQQKALLVVESWLTEHKKDHILMQNMPELRRLKNLRKHRIDQQKQLNTFNKAYKKSFSDSTKNLKQLSVTEKKITRSKKYLETLSHELELIADGHSPEEVIALYQEQQERIANFVELFSLAKIYQRFVSKGFSKRYAHLDNAQLNKQLELKNVQIESAKNIQQVLEKAAYREQLILQLATDREKLEYDTPCPLCGSLDHPYTSKPPSVADSQKALNEQLANIKTLQSEAKRITQQSIAYNNVQDENTKYAEQINRIQAEWLVLCTHLNAVSKQFNINSHRAMKARIKTEKQELKEMSILIKQLRAKKKEMTKLDVELIKKQTDLENMRTRQQELDTNHQGQAQEIVTLKTELANCIQAENTLAKMINTLLVTLGEKLPRVGKEDDLYDLLSKRQQDYQTYNARQQQLADESTQIRLKATASHEISQHQAHQLQALSTQIREQEIVHRYFSKLDLQSQLARQDKTIAQLKLDSSQQLTALNMQLQQSNYQSLGNVQALIGLCLRKDEVRILCEKMQENIAHYAAKIKALHQQLDAEYTHISTQETPESVAIKLRDKQVQIEIAQQEVATLEVSLQKQQQLSQQKQQLTEHIEQQEISVQQKQEQQQKINTEPENALRRRVQIAIAEKLLVLTNSFLDKISDRYHVARVPSDFGLAIEIIDNKQQQSKRTVKSLSGGETFVVSLAMALSLSEIANNGRAIDSLFIDEGFGNLDAETLYTVITTLEALKAQGKTVGIISHVQAIKEHIKTQLELIKQPNGMSQLITQDQGTFL